jgi:hypothetical protein
MYIFIEGKKVLIKNIFYFQWKCTSVILSNFTNLRKNTLKIFYTFNDNVYE